MVEEQRIRDSAHAYQVNNAGFKHFVFGFVIELRNKKAVQFWTAFSLIDGVVGFYCFFHSLSFSLARASLRAFASADSLNSGPCGKY